jgi:predicted small lipoprotein YifL
MRPRSRAWITTAVLIGVALSVSACGRKGPLEPPPNAGVEEQGKLEAGEAPTKGTRQKFLLDFLL